MFLAADIGGTKSLFGMFEYADGTLERIREGELLTGSADDPVELVREFTGSERPAAMSIAVAGAVVDGAARGSNLAWTVQAESLRAAFGCPVRLLNDLEATARYVPQAAPGEFEVLQVGERLEDAPIGVIAPGTGIGEAILLAGPTGYRSYPSEAGHIDFAPTDERQDRWLRHLRTRHGRVSLERACSGVMMKPMYEFLRSLDEAEPDPATSREIAAADDPGPVITNAAVAGTCPVCVATLDMFTDILGAAAGNLALQVLARGGIVLAGGIPSKILPLLRRDRFLARFNDKGRFAYLMRSMPVSVLLNPAAGLMGAAWFHADRMAG